MHPPEARVILLVDDVEQVVSIAAEYLERKLPNVRVVTHARAEDALAWLRTAPRVDLVLTDNHMGGGMDGIELLGRVRDERPDAVRALMTAYLDIDATPEELARRGVHALVRKPWEWPELARFLARLLGLPAEERARVEREGPVPFPPNALQELAARASPAAVAADAAREAERARQARDERELPPEPHAVRRVHRDAAGRTLVECPECACAFEVELEAPQPSPSPRRDSAPMLPDDEEARRLLAYLRARPAVAQRMRALQDARTPDARRRG